MFELSGIQYSKSRHYKVKEMTSSRVASAKPDSKYYDYSHFPKKFKTENEALDAYNELGFQFKLQFQI
jgi:hypothetical protein